MTAMGTGSWISLPDRHSGFQPVRMETKVFLISQTIIRFRLDQGPDPRHLHFLMFNEDGCYLSWYDYFPDAGASAPPDNHCRNSAIGPEWAGSPPFSLDPLVGVDNVNDASEYPGFVNPNFIHVSPIFDSDVSDLGSCNWQGSPVPCVNAKTKRNGLLAFKVVDWRPRYWFDQKLPELQLEIVDPDTINLEDVAPGGGTSSPGAARLVK